MENNVKTGNSISYCCSWVAYICWNGNGSRILGIFGWNKFIRKFIEKSWE